VPESAWDVWFRLRKRFGASITLIDLYELEALRLGMTEAELAEQDRRRLVASWVPVATPNWERVAEVSRRSDPIEIVSYDESWPKRFNFWQSRLDEALNVAAVAIEHVGSTAVPGMAGKPLIDIQLSVADAENESAYRPAIESTGLELYSREPGHRLFLPPVDASRDTHVHVCQFGSIWEKEHLDFRDKLRINPLLCRSYEQLKRKLAKRYRYDRLAYTEAKTEFILSVLYGTPYVERD
jgi:GrpB-like predicted nucleotidyltransferase (UPF0157 family)